MKHCLVYPKQLFKHRRKLEKGQSSNWAVLIDSSLKTEAVALNARKCRFFFFLLVNDVLYKIFDDCNTLKSEKI